MQIINKIFKYKPTYFDLGITYLSTITQEFHNSKQRQKKKKNNQND